MPTDLKNVEIEQTAKLTKDQFNQLLKFLTKNLTPTETFQRFMIRFHKEKIDVKESLDVRYKWTSGKNQLVVKKGALGSQSRQETTINLGENNQLEHFATLFALLGYKIANAMFREGKRFTNDKVEVSIVNSNTGKTGEAIYFIEVESINAKSKKEALEHLEEFFTVNKIKPLSKSEYQTYLRFTDRTVNFKFPMNDLAKSLSEHQYLGSTAKSTILR